MLLSAETRSSIDGPPQHFVLDNETYEVLPGEWWPALRTIRLDNPWAFSFLLGVAHPEDGAVLADRLLNDRDPLTQQDLQPIAEQLVERATGRKWWVAARLAVVVDHNWASVDGRLLAKGTDLLPMLKLTPVRALNVVHAMLYEHADERRAHQLDEELSRPPRSVLAQRRTTAEDAATFEASFVSAGSL